MALQKPNSCNAIKKDINKTDARHINPNRKPSSIPKVAEKKLPVSNTDRNVKKDVPTTNKVSVAIGHAKTESSITIKTSDVMKNNTIKSIAPKPMTKPTLLPISSLQPHKTDNLTQKYSKPNSNRVSVFDRLYKPKTVTKKQPDDVTKLQTDPNYLKKVLKDSSPIVSNKQHTVFDFKSSDGPALAGPPVRRSLSAIHFKRISKNEINNCIHKWSSVGEKLNKVNLEEMIEDEGIKVDKVISAVKSERKRVKFQAPVPSNFNTPRPEELQSRLKAWLQKRGKYLDSYHHLQYFGLHHVAQKLRPLDNAPRFDLYDDEDKENIAVENDSYMKNMNDAIEDNLDNINGQLDIGRDKWRCTTYVSDSGELNKTRGKWHCTTYVSDSGELNKTRGKWHCTTYMSDSGELNKTRGKWHYTTYVSDSGELNETRDTVYSAVTSDAPPADDLLAGALNDLTNLLKEGFEWEQCARWLRALREWFPAAAESAAYWECRAALEERRGDLPASAQCWEEAIAKGTERSVVEANLDQLLDKFMQLEISPTGGQRRIADPKMVDIKNVFESTIIRFALQQAKLPTIHSRGSGGMSHYTVTPRKTPLQQVCTSVRHMDMPNPLIFVNDKLCETP